MKEENKMQIKPQRTEKQLANDKIMGQKLSKALRQAFLRRYVLNQKKPVFYQGLVNPLKLNISDKTKEILGKKE